MDGHNKSGHPDYDYKSSKWDHSSTSCRVFQSQSIEIPLIPVLIFL